VPLSDRVPDLAALEMLFAVARGPRDLLAHVTAGQPVATR
jgi:hypothetical protein